MNLTLQTASALTEQQRDDAHQSGSRYIGERAQKQDQADQPVGMRQQVFRQT